MTMGIQLSSVSASYQGKTALKDITTLLPKGQIIGVIGPNGAGKSTLIKSIIDLKKHTGTVNFMGQALTAVQKEIAYVEQRSSLDLDFPVSVFETVLMGTYPKLGLIKRPGAKEKQATHDALVRVGMEEYADKQIGELSGGQLQRVFIARVVAQDADWIFLDEPFVGIDMVSEQIIVDLLKAMRNQGKTIVIVHHDLSKVINYFDYLVVLRKSLVASGAVEQVFTKHTLKAAYDTNFSDLD
ncbi:MAG: metal ABC transporter ATP-binding protein [Aerococcus sp.]|nr:metal ABC transporter ATP-binding protein [Aerococcus sp.]